MGGQSLALKFETQSGDFLSDLEDLDDLIRSFTVDRSVFC